ncbi:glycosyltransferase [Desulfoscipio sp. XC116]|uniref:glycosyltransferase family 2 protein n=1 Tax=Desulfoscipio sp. XC116 TaxID=3144975 RepID=UPI00325BA244
MIYSIIIPYHSNQILLHACLDSLISTIPDGVEIIIVANNSNPKEHSIELPYAQCRLIKVNYELFYPKAIHLGVEQAKGQYVIFCDADTVYTKGWFQALTSFYQQQEGIGYASSKLLNPYDETIIDFGIGFTEFNSPHPFRGRNKHFHLADQSFCAQAACAASSLIRKKLFIDIGGFNEKLMHSYSDIDLCLRLKEKGFSTWCINDSLVFHKGNSTYNSGMSNHLKGDTKGQYMAVCSGKIKIDMDHYFKIAADYFISQCVFLHKEYYLIDFTTIADKRWHYELFEDLLNISFSDVYNRPYKVRDADHIPLYELLDSNIRQMRFPILYFVDDFRALQTNTIWKYLRDCSWDIVIDRNANILRITEI